MTPEDIRYYSSTRGAVCELLSFAQVEVTEKASLVAELKEDEIHHLGVVKKAKSDEKTRQILTCLQQTLERVSETEVKQTLSLLNKDEESSWKSFQVAKKALNAFMKNFELPELSLRRAETSPHMQVYATSAQACDALQQAFQSLGTRGAGTYTFSQHENECQLHILAQGGVVTSFVFSLVTDQLGRVSLAQGDRIYPDVGVFLNQLHVNQIADLLAGKRAGTYCTAKIGQQNVLYLVLPSSKIASYSYTFQTSSRAVYLSQKGAFSSAEELIKASFPELPVAIRSKRAAVDASNDPVGMFCETGSGFTASISVVTGKNKIQTISYTADERPEQFCVIQGGSYKSVHAFVQERVQWKVAVHKLDTSQFRTAHAYPSLLQENIEGQLLDHPPGAFSMHEGTLYLVVSRDEVKRYTGISDPYAFVQSCAPKQEMLEVQLAPFYPLEAVRTQIETIGSLRDSFGCHCLESEEIAFLRIFEGIEPHPFFLRPVLAGQRGDFTLVAGLQRSRMGTTLPVWQENIEILPGGKIAHISHKTRGTHGRVFENFSQMKEWWGLGSFIYDAYAAMEASYEIDGIMPCCFVLSKTDDKFFVTVRKDEYLDPITYELQHIQGAFYLGIDDKRILIEGEVIQALEKIFGVSSFGAVFELQAAISPYVQSQEPQFEKFAHHGTLFSITQKESAFLMSTYSKRAYGWLNPAIEKGTLQISSSGQVQFGKSCTFESVQGFKNYLGQMHSVKVLETQTEELLLAQKREEALSLQLSRTLGFIEGGRNQVERQLLPYTRELSLLKEKHYTLCKDRDENGINKFYCSWVDKTGNVVHSLVADEDVVRIAAGEEIFKVSPFIAKKLELDEAKRRFSEACNCISSNPNFYNEMPGVAAARFLELRDFFGGSKVAASWLIRPSVPTHASFFAPASIPDVTECELQVVDGDAEVGNYLFSIDSQTGKFCAGGILYDTLEEVVTYYGGDYQTACNILFDEMAICQTQEKGLSESPRVEKTGEGCFKIESEVVSSRENPGFLTGSDGTVYKDIEDVLKSLEYQKAVPLQKKEKVKSKPKASTQIDLKFDERYALLGVGEKDLTPETRIRRLIIWLDELRETEDRCSKLEAQVIAPWIGPKDSIDKFMKKPLRTMNLPRDAAHLQKSDVIELLQVFLRTARG